MGQPACHCRYSRCRQVLLQVFCVDCVGVYIVPHTTHARRS